MPQTKNRIINGPGQRRPAAQRTLTSSSSHPPPPTSTPSTTPTERLNSAPHEPTTTIGPTNTLTGPHRSLVDQIETNSASTTRPLLPTSSTTTTTAMTTSTNLPIILQQQQLPRMIPPPPTFSYTVFTNRTQEQVNSMMPSFRLYPSIKNTTPSTNPNQSSTRSLYFVAPQQTTSLKRPLNYRMHMLEKISSDSPPNEISPRTNKRRKPEEPDKQLIRIPLEMGWKRVTHVRLITKAGVRGDVVYFSPDQRKLKSFQEIDRYLLKNPNSDFSVNLNRYNFTFSSKFLIGTFIRHTLAKESSKETLHEELTEQQIIELIKKQNPDFRNKELTSKRSSRDISIQRHHPDSPQSSKQMSTNAHRSKSNKSNPSGEKRPRQLQLKWTEKRIFLNPSAVPVFPPRFMPARSQFSILSGECSCPIFIRRKTSLKQIITKIYPNDREKTTSLVRLLNSPKGIMEDLLITDSNPLPEFKFIRGTQNPEIHDAFGNLFMSFQLITIFKEQFEFEGVSKLSPSTLWLLSLGAHRATAKLMSTDSVLIEWASIDMLKFLLDIGHFMLEQIVACVPVDEFSLAALLDILIRDEKKYDRFSVLNNTTFTDELSSKLFGELSLVHKSIAFRWLCDEFLSTKSAYSYIDDHINMLVSARQRMRKLCGDLRKTKRPNIARSSRSSVPATLIHQNSGCSGGGETDELTEDMSYGTTTTVPDSDTLVVQEEQLRIEQLVNSQILRIENLGCDRYYRRYWFIPQLYAIYIESTIVLQVDTVEGKQCFFDGCTRTSSYRENDQAREINGTNSVDISNYSEERQEKYSYAVRTFPSVGWYVLNDKLSFKRLLKCLCEHGERESHLLTTIHRNLEFISKHINEEGNALMESSKTYEQQFPEMKGPTKCMDCLRVLVDIIDQFKLRVKLACLCSHPFNDVNNDAEVVESCQMFENQQNLQYNIDKTRNCLLCVEVSVERRYLNDEAKLKVNSWRNSVKTCKSLSRLCKTVTPL